jgi:hypothetical protein
MSTYIFESRTKPQAVQGQPPPILRFMLFLPGGYGAFNRQQLLGYVRQYNLGSAGLAYGIRELGAANDAPVVVSEAQYAQLTQVPVQGAHPGTQPTGIQGQDRQDTPCDAMGFQLLGDAAMGGAGQDPMFGDNGDSTYQDIYIDPVQGAQEVPRPAPQQNPQ